ncbi:MAG: hypothetical protein ABJB66_03485 [Gemmatimonadaceae bacterium]
MRLRIASSVAAFSVALFAAACNVAAPTQLSANPGLVVFSVLDPTAAEQTILLMQTRASVTDTTARNVNIDDPIVSAGEIPVMSARVVLYGPTGDSAVAVEDRLRRTDNLGAGVYRIWSTGNPAALPTGAFMAVTQGGNYTLKVQSVVGNGTGTTRVPSNSRNLNVAARTVFRSRDTVMLGESDVQGSGFIYALRSAAGTQTEGSPQFRRDLERRLMLPSGNEWAFAYVRDRFTTGSRHILTITAADSSYFGYFGSGADPFADRTGRTTLKGASGVFGSVLLIYSSTITVGSQ